jgi:hypothetical protein
MRRILSVVPGLVATVVKIESLFFSTGKYTVRIHCRECDPIFMTYIMTILKSNKYIYSIKHYIKCELCDLLSGTLNSFRSCSASL